MRGNVVACSTTGYHTMFKHTYIDSSNPPEAVFKNSGSPKGKKI